MIRINRAQLIKITDEYIKKIIKNKELIKNLEAEVKDSKYDNIKVTELRLKINSIKADFNKIVKLIGILNYDDQRIICYRYMEKLTYEKIALNIGCSRNTVPRRINKNLLRLGRVLFGFEKEFYEEFYDGELLFE